MRSIAVSSMLFVLAILSCLYLYNYFFHEGITIKQALAPMQSLSNARHATEEKKLAQSIKEIDDAIMAMRIIEHYADSTAEKYIEIAVTDLRIVEAEIKRDSIILEDLNLAFFKALNSIAYANLTIAEQNLEKGAKYRAMLIMNASFAEMTKSLDFATDDFAKDKERQVINDVHSMLKDIKDADYNYRFDYDSINLEFKELIK